MFWEAPGTESRLSLSDFGEVSRRFWGAPGTSSRFSLADFGTFAEVWGRFRDGVAIEFARFGGDFGKGRVPSRKVIFPGGYLVLST